MGSAKPNIGCKIGLISKAQNRYEGILYTIDKVNSTVVLAKGECCRPVHEHRLIKYLKHNFALIWLETLD